MRYFIVEGTIINADLMNDNIIEKTYGVFTKSNE